MKRHIRRHILTAILLGSVLGVAAAGTPAQAQTRFGGGIHYLRTVGDIKNTQGFDANAVGFMASVVNGTGLRFEGDLELVPDFGGSNKTMWQPQAFAMLGRPIYGGIGMGIGYFNGSWQSNPFFAIRAGVNLPMSNVDLDLFASYRFQRDKNFSDVTKDDLNSITFGALIHFGR